MKTVTGQKLVTKCVKIDGDSKITDLIYVFDDFVLSEDCDRMIQWFHDNEDKHKDGVVNSGTGVDEHTIDKSAKNCREATVPSEDPISELLTDITRNAYYKILENGVTGPVTDLFINGYSIRKYPVNEGIFETHVDQHAGDSVCRLFAVLIYLNDVVEGGETLFPTWGLGVKPKKGRVLIFPCNWLFPHKGCIPVSEPKYMSAMFLNFVPQDIEPPIETDSQSN